MSGTATRAVVERRDRAARGEVPLLTTVLVASQIIEAPLDSKCGGRARCGTCCFEVIAGARALSPPTVAERRFRLPAHLRLGCQARLLGNVALVAAAPAETGTDRDTGQNEPEA